jgi:hypothetical protein
MSLSTYDEKSGRSDQECVPSTPGETSVLEEAYTTGIHPDLKHPLNLPT